MKKLNIILVLEWFLFLLAVVLDLRLCVVIFLGLNWIFSTIVVGVMAVITKMIKLLELVFRLEGDG